MKNMNMTLFSHSRLSCFERCPLKFRFRYIDKLKVARQQGVEAFLGTLVHAALEKLYKDLRFRKMNSLEDLIAWFRAEWKRNWSNDIIIVRKQYTRENYMKMGEDYIGDYYKRYHPFNQTRTIALEEKVTINLDSGKKYRLLSREHCERLKQMVNQDTEVRELGRQHDMTCSLAVKNADTGHTVCFYYDRGKIVKMDHSENADFRISGREDILRKVFNRQIDPFVASTQGKVETAGDFAKMSRWYPVLVRTFKLWAEVPVEPFKG